MKRLIYHSLSVVLLILVLGSCENEKDEVLFTNVEAQDDDLAVIKQLGFDEYSVVDLGDYYLVEGDISIPKENINGYARLIKNQFPTTRQAHTDAIIAINNASDIKIFIDPALSSRSNWKQAITTVIRHYNNVGCYIKMREVNTNPDITFYLGGTTHWGIGEFPSGDGKPGKTVRIKDGNDADNLSLAQKIFLIAHEMGHNLGFRHSDYLTEYFGRAEGEGDSGANHIPGTPTGTSTSQDPNSVFNSSRFYGGQVIAWRGFSRYDEIAMKYLYPKVTMDITIVDENCTVKLLNLPSGASIIWSVSDSNVEMKNPTNTGISLLAHKLPANFDLQARIDIHGNEQVITETIEVIEYINLIDGIATITYEYPFTVRSFIIPELPGQVKTNENSVKFFVDYYEWEKIGKPDELMGYLTLINNLLSGINKNDRRKMRVKFINAPTIKPRPGQPQI